MNADGIIRVFLIIDTLMERLDHHSDVRAQVPDSEILTVAVVAAKYVQNHHERAVCIMHACRDLAGPIRISRFNRRVHALADGLPLLGETLGELGKQGEVLVIDSLPVPVCRRARARRWCKGRGRICCGSCAAKHEKCFGWRRPLIGTPAGVPVRVSLLPAALHDLPPVHELTYAWPEGARVFGDTAFTSLADAESIFEAIGVRLIPIRKATLQPPTWLLDELELREDRHTIETVNSQLEKMGIERLHAQTNSGLDLKVYASLIALACSNLN